jgi:hypothetical protein
MHPDAKVVHVELHAAHQQELIADDERRQQQHGQGRQLVPQKGERQQHAEQHDRQRQHARIGQPRFHADDLGLGCANRVLFFHGGVPRFCSIFKAASSHGMPG